MAAQETLTRERPGRRAPRMPRARGVMGVTLPPLESGDRLTRYEFERRYEAMPHIKKAELIEGIVYMSTPVRVSHGESHGQIIGWFAVYCAATPGIHLGDNITVRLDMDNDVQPDAVLWLDEALGGRSRISEDDYLEGAPELIVEIAATSVAYDLHDKLKVYRRHGVQEYVVWQIYDNRLDWFELSDGEYAPLLHDADGIIRSRVFPGLHLVVAALLNGDVAGVLAELQRGVETAEHVAFVKRLSEHIAHP